MSGGVEALAEIIAPLLPLDFEAHESQTIKDAALRDRNALARKIAKALAAQIAAAEQRGREDNADHGQCYVFGSKALAAVRAEAWDEGHRDVCNDCCCRPGINPYRDSGA